eukprot:CAMPEP_0181472312 /NCGR_PEP_ID=MMETSP1110-20121109/39536_1 /TAXON_ID=174948 /ORGANISM="Symbiodinium sp., Strain CCMP421" /LENGTH=368 /DNA_ID=CAMNT_0023597379 /DNA_START=75 /DNA_END=1179 /DNA_ORIENTATION=-
MATERDGREAQERTSKLVPEVKASGTNFWMIVIVAIWFSSSIVFNVTAQMLLRNLPSAEDMTIIELMVTVLVGALTLPPRGHRLLAKEDGFPLKSSFSLGLLHLFNCRSFVYSLQFIPTSLAQTIRATNPVWVVLLTFALGARYGLLVLCSLLPLVGGFALAVGAEPSGFEPQGILAAVLSVNAQVCVNLLGQRCMARSREGSGRALHAFEVQFNSCFFALCILVPIWLMGGGASRLLGFLSVVDDQLRNRILVLSLADGFLYFTEQSASFAALNSFRPLNFAVVDTLRRLLIVLVAGFWVQGSALSASSALGVLLVLTGGVWFAYARDREDQRRTLEKQDWPLPRSGVMTISALRSSPLALGCSQFG